MLFLLKVSMYMFIGCAMLGGLIMLKFVVQSLSDAFESVKKVPCIVKSFTSTPKP